MCFFILLMKLVYFADNLSYLLIIFCSFNFILFLLNINVWKMHLIQKFMIFKDDTWTDLDYIYLWKCWSYICSSKIIKKYWNIHFLHQIILFLFFNFSFLFFFFLLFLLFFSSANPKGYKVLGQDMLWYSPKAVKDLLHVHHAVKTVFPWNIW